MHVVTSLKRFFWLCPDSLDAVKEFGMTSKDAAERRTHALARAESEGLLEIDELVKARMANGHGESICPLCLEVLSAYGFFRRLAQAMGRNVHDLTVTEINLFHIRELRFGEFNHRPYNIGWGHHHCNVVVKDSGIDDTLTWMDTVLD